MMGNASFAEGFWFAMSVAGLAISWLLLRLAARDACSARISTHPNRLEWLSIAQNDLRIESAHLGFHFICATIGWLAMQAPPPAAPSVRNLLSVVIPFLLFSVQWAFVAAGYLNWRHREGLLKVSIALGDASQAKTDG